jgi:glycosyltransferase involved in cell wall biosynthesis
MPPRPTSFRSSSNCGLISARTEANISASQGFSVSAFRAQGRKVLLYLGRLHPKKNIAALIKAFAQTQKSEVRGRRSEKWVLAIGGWDQAGHEAQLRQLTSDLGLLTSVLFLGARFGAEKDALYRACDAFVLPSLSEGLPMAVLEAWAYAKPVLMTPECNLPEGFAAQAAVQIDPTVEGIVQGLRTLLEIPEATLLEMGARGRRLVEQRFTWPRIAIQVKETYEWMLGGSPEPSWMFE